MEPLNDTHDQRVQNIKWATHAWVGTLRDSDTKDISPDFRPSVTWDRKISEPVTDTDDVACLLSADMCRLSQPGINLDSWLIYGESFDTPDMLVIDVEGVVLGLHIEKDQDSAHTPYTLHVRVLDHIPDVKVICDLGGGSVSISVSDHMHMWWTLENPTRRHVKEALQNLLIAAHHFRGELRVNRMHRIDAALASQGMESVHAHNYRDLVDWITPMVGIDMGGEPWGRKTWVRLMDADGTPENKSLERTVKLTHPMVRDPLFLKTTEADGLHGWAVELHAHSGTGSIDTTINQPTQAQITEIITRWWRLGETITKNQETATDGH